MVERIGHLISQGYIIIDIVHERIHEGNHYTVNTNQTGLDIDDTLKIGITVPAKAGNVSYHMVSKISATGTGEICFFEGSTFTGGTALPVFNSNRNSSNTTSLTFVKDPTVTVDGTDIYHTTLGSSSPGRQVGGETNGREEYILKYSTKYTLCFTSLANSNTGNIDLSFYENK